MKIDILDMNDQSQLCLEREEAVLICRDDVKHPELTSEWSTRNMLTAWKWVTVVTTNHNILTLSHHTSISWNKSARIKCLEKLQTLKFQRDNSIQTHSSQRGRQILGTLHAHVVKCLPDLWLKTFSSLFSWANQHMVDKDQARLEGIIFSIDPYAP